jgi:hypothetical protein
MTGIREALYVVSGERSEEKTDAEIETEQET